jgi:hypothetical protein
MVTKTSRTIAEAEAEAAHHLAEHDANGLPGPSPAATEPRISRAWASVRAQLDAGVDWTKSWPMASDGRHRRRTGYPR